MRYIHDLYIMLSQGYVDKNADYPGCFAQVKVYGKPYYNTASFLYYPKEDEGNLSQKKKRYSNFYLYSCAIYEIVAPAHLGSDNYVLQIINTNCFKLFIDGDAARSV